MAHTFTKRALFDTFDDGISEFLTYRTYALDLFIGERFVSDNLVFTSIYLHNIHFIIIQTVGTRDSSLALLINSSEKYND